MNSFIKAINNPKEALLEGNKTIAWTLVLITVLSSSLLAPVISHYFSIAHRTEISISHIILVTIYGIASYVAFCVFMWAICKLFGSKATLDTYIQIWGLTLVPTALCALIVPFTETFFYIFWNNSIWGIAMSIIFFTILIWKFILYVLFLNKVCELSKWRLLGAMVIIGIGIVVFACFECRYLGILVPII